MEKGIFQNAGEFETLAHAAGYKAGKLALLSSLSSRQFRRIFHKRFGCSLQEWLDALKLLKAQSGLCAGEPIKQIALVLGYKHPSSFCHWFKHLSGLRPAEFIALKVSPQLARVTVSVFPNTMSAFPNG